MPTESILRVNHVSKEFLIRSSKLFGATQKLHALNDISLDVYEGETLGIIGESGCGKSTLGRCMVRLHKPTSGEIYLHDKNIFEAKGEEAKRLCKEIQMVFQDPYSSLDPRKTAGNLIGEPMIIHGICKDRKERDERVLNLMQQVGLDVQHIEKYPHEFSGGQRQRINIARALALNPKIIVCDEPVSALDVSVQAQVLNLLNGLQQEAGLTYVFISHDLSVVKHISDRVAIMYLGQVVELAPVEELYSAPLHPYTKALISAVPPSSPLVKKTPPNLKGELTSPIGDQVGCPLAARCPYATSICKEECPAFRDMGNNHFVACHLV